MLLTPLLLVAADRWWMPRLARQAQRAGSTELERAAERAGDHRRLRPLRADRRPPAVRQRRARRPCSTTTPSRSRRCASFGWRVYYGDATRLDLLRTAGADERARAGGRDRRRGAAASRWSTLVREHFPQLTIVARARNVHALLRAARSAASTLIERETLDSALMSGAQRARAARLAAAPRRARLALRFRRHNVEQLRDDGAARKDEARLIAIAKAGRQQLEELGAGAPGQRGATRPARLARPGGGAGRRGVMEPPSSLRSLPPKGAAR